MANDQPAPPPDDPLRDVLVLTVRKSFWASPESRGFPHRVYSPSVHGTSTSRTNTVLFALKAIVPLLRLRPRIVLVGSAHRLVPWLLVLRRLGILRAKVVATNRVFFGRRLARYADRIVVYSRAEIEDEHRDRFAPIPADGSFSTVVPHREPEPYVFTGGYAERDFQSVVEAVAPLAVRLKLVTSPDCLGVTGPVPPNCEVSGAVPLDHFLALMAGAHVVVVPLEGGGSYGHTMVAQALCLGKAVVTTRSAGVDDYVRDGREGLLVEAGDVEGYRRALATLLGDDELRHACERAALSRAPELTYAAFARSLEALCREILDDRGPAR
jgi:glycosyltransferase involved in cell wall biosynthesis